MVEALDIEIHGIVQGVGFRPFVYGLAREHSLAGWVLNDVSGVFIHAEGEPDKIDTLVLNLSERAPAAARVDEILLHESQVEGCAGFTIRQSDEDAGCATTLVSPDLATCNDCVRELFDPNDRRYHYPFINCTNCGPRFTVIEELPYDRPKTSMSRFIMCDTCAAEYADPANRRFHAQPDACFECGPHISWIDARHAQGELCVSDALWGTTRNQSDAIFENAVELLRSGGILAVKGLGGFHLACDAHNENTLAELRRRKRRRGKAFAVMMPSLEAASLVCEIGSAEKGLLTGSQRPIVLLKKKPGAHFAHGLADSLPELGVMLPYTPLQHLLMAAYGKPLVMTSGNIHDEPIQTDDEKAYRTLRGVADAFLGNDRPILCRFDDSVVRVIRIGDTEEAIQMVRRARGFAPLPVKVNRMKAATSQTENLPEDADLANKSKSHPSKAEHQTLQSTSNEEGCASTSATHRPLEQTAPCILAVGPEQKNTLTLLRGEDAFVSQHIGDMENAAVFDAWIEAKNHFEKLFGASPNALACDMHPDYLATKWARAESTTCELPLVEVQHHHSHVAAVMAENSLDEAVIGVAFDGTGYGADGRIWGGEVLIANRADYERFANFAYIPMPGGTACIKRPLRMAYAALWEFDLLDHPAAAHVTKDLGQTEARLCDQMMEGGLNAPMTSSVGRLFDAMSALLGICTQPTYEGEAAILFEAAIDPAYEHIRDAWRLSRAKYSPADGYADVPPRDNTALTLGNAEYQIGLIKNAASENSTAHDTSMVLLDAEPLLRGVLDDMEAGIARGIIAGKVHDAFVDAIVLVCQAAHAVCGITTVVLAGGVFMNRYLVEHAAAAIRSIGLTVALSKDLPPNDGAISYGQATVAAKRLEERENHVPSYPR